MSARSKSKVAKKPRPNRIRPAVQYALARRGVPSATRLRRWTLGYRGVTLRIVGAREGRRINRQFRGVNRPTNVLSFSTGDIVLCHPVIEREARRQGKSLAAHYAHLVVHGVLHLRGYDHKRKGEAARMENAERRILARLGFGDPYAVESAAPR
ncbi:MAG TPA: rRNA maturation RNase YbeY [Burkholderiales bacterium]|nr:rRNA maturation RNase YbeY [Burkholderiales bacterium]